MVQNEEGEAEVDSDLAIEKLVQVGLLELGEAGLVVHPLLGEYARAVDRDEGESVLPRLAHWLAMLSYDTNETGIPANFVPLRAYNHRGRLSNVQPTSCQQDDNLCYAQDYHGDPSQI